MKFIQSVILVLLVNIVASYILTTNTGTGQENISVISESFLKNKISTTPSSNGSFMIKNTTNLPITTFIAVISNKSKYEMGKIEEKAVSTTTRSWNYTYNTTYPTYYATTTSSGLSAGSIAGIVIGVLVGICCCCCCWILSDSDDSSKRTVVVATRATGHWEYFRRWVSD